MREDPVVVAVALLLIVVVVLGLVAVGIVLGAARLEERRSGRAARELVGGVWDVEDARDDR